MKIAVVVAQDRNGNSLARKAGTGRVTAEEIDEVLGEYIQPSVLLCTDTATNYKRYAKMKGLTHETINERKSGRVKDGIIHIQHVNNYHYRLKKWLERFNGVGTRYLDAYLDWFRWLNKRKDTSTKKQVSQLFLLACERVSGLTVEIIRRA